MNVHRSQQADLIKKVTRVAKGILVTSILSLLLVLVLVTLPKIESSRFKLGICSVTATKLITAQDKRLRCDCIKRNTNAKCTIYYPCLQIYVTYNSERSNMERPCNWDNQKGWQETLFPNSVKESGSSETRSSTVLRIVREICYWLCSILSSVFAPGLLAFRRAGAPSYLIITRSSGFRFCLAQRSRWRGGPSFFQFVLWDDESILRKHSHDDRHISSAHFFILNDALARQLSLFHDF